jgi:hypothetical protein
MELELDIADLRVLGAEAPIFYSQEFLISFERSLSLLNQRATSLWPTGVSIFLSRSTFKFRVLVVTPAGSTMVT